MKKKIHFKPASAGFNVIFSAVIATVTLMHGCPSKEAVYLSLNLTLYIHVKKRFSFTK